MISLVKISALAPRSVSRSAITRPEMRRRGLINTGPREAMIRLSRARFGKFRARNPFLRGRACRLIIGYVGQALADMETRHFVMDSSTGPTPDGAFTITAKDVLKYADDDRAQAPRPSNGSLLADLTNSSNVLHYIAFRHRQCGVSIIRLHRRWWKGDHGVLHAEWRRVHNHPRAIQHNGHCSQGVGRGAALPALLCGGPGRCDQGSTVTYAGVPSTYITIANWQAESAAYLGRVITTLIAQPVGVNSLPQGDHTADGLRALVG